MKYCLDIYMLYKFRVKILPNKDGYKAMLFVKSNTIVELETMELSEFVKRFSKHSFILRVCDFFVTINEKDIVNFIKHENINSFNIYKKHNHSCCLEEASDYGQSILNKLDKYHYILEWLYFNKSG